MGGRGTDVAREAAALVLLDDNFASLVGAIRLGRRIYSNIRHAMSFIMAVHIPIAGMGLAPVLMGWPLLLYPMHVLFLEFLIDPACAFVFEADAEAADTMRRPPRPSNARLFSTTTVLHSLWLGLVVLAFCVAVYSIALKLLTEPQARALSFIALVVANLALIFVTRSHRLSFRALLARRNNVFWWITLAALTALLVVLNVPSIADLFRFDTPPLAVSVATLLGGVALVLIAGRLQRPPG
jgi:Ca2+-transporting ATPase